MTITNKPRTRKKTYSDDTIHEPSQERLSREKLIAEYGSLDTYREKNDLLKRDAELVSQFAEAIKGKEANETEVLKTLEALPFWMDPLQLKGLSLGALGAPEGSKEWDAI